MRARLPEDPAVDTERRADRGRELLGRYMALTGTDEDAALGDLLADLLRRWSADPARLARARAAARLSRLSSSDWIFTHLLRVMGLTPTSLATALIGRPVSSTIRAERFRNRQS